MLALVIAALVAFCGHPGRQSAQRQTALPGFVPTLMARASPRSSTCSVPPGEPRPARVELLRSTDDGEHFQAVTAPPGTAPSAGAPLGDIEHLSFVSPEEGFVVRAAEDDGVLGPTSVVVTEDGGESWRLVDLPVEPRNLPWDKGVTLVGPVQPVVARSTRWRSRAPAAPTARLPPLPRGELVFSSGPRGQPGEREQLVQCCRQHRPFRRRGPGVAYYGERQGVVNLFGSADDGNSFRLLTANFTRNSCGLGPTSSQLVWLTCDGGMMMTFYRSTDAGERFVALPVPVRQHRWHGGVGDGGAADVLHDRGGFGQWFLLVRLTTGGASRSCTGCPERSAQWSDISDLSFGDTSGARADLNRYALPLPRPRRHLGARAHAWSRDGRELELATVNVTTGVIDLAASDVQGSKRRPIAGAGERSCLMGGPAG